jgi:Flp pilus assembly protein TadG
MYKDNSGHITVETVGTFIPLMLLVVSILSLVNIVSVQARVHYALTQTAMTLSVYSYVLEAGAMTESLNSVFSGIGQMTDSSVANTGDSISTIENIINNAKSSVANLVLDGMMQPIMRGYLANGDMSGDEYLRRSGIVNLWFKTVELPYSNGDVKLTIQYEIDYTFGALPLPFGPTLKVTQTAITKGWLNGSGEGYW